MSSRRSRLLSTALAMACAVACSGTPALAPCGSATQFAYDPVGKPDLATAFPDDFFTTDAPAALTGLAVNLTPTSAPWTTINIPIALQDTFLAFNDLDGWGTTAGITLRFTSPLINPPNGSPASTESSTLQLWELGDSPVRVPYETQLTDNNNTVIVWPMVPLKPATQHVLIMTRSEPTMAGGPVCPSDTFESILDGRAANAAYKRLSPRYAAALKATGVAADQVGAAVVFTTQSMPPRLTPKYEKWDWSRSGLPSPSTSPTVASRRRSCSLS